MRFQSKRANFPLRRFQRENIISIKTQSATHPDADGGIANGDRFIRTVRMVLYHLQVESGHVFFLCVIRHEIRNYKMCFDYLAEIVIC